MLVERAAFEQPRFVAAEGRHQEAGLSEQLRRALIEIGGRRQLKGQQTIEVVHRAVQAAEIVVERQHFGDQGRAHVERRRQAGVFGVAGGRRHQRLALEARQAARVGQQPRDQQVVEVGARANRGHGDLGTQAIPQGALELLARRPGRDQDERVGAGGVGAGYLHEVRAKARQIWRAQQARASGRDHRGDGGSMAAARSARARW